MNKSNIVITINRQLGSGGKYLGSKLAEKLSFLYLDKEIVKEVAKDLDTYVENLESSDEKQGSIWNSALLLSAFGSFDYIPPVEIISDSEAHKAESNFITKVASEKSAVIIGRGGSYILRNHPRHVSIFLHADMEFRKKQTQELNGISEKEALHLIEKTDKERLKYYKVLTGQDMYNICGYDLTIDTGKLGLEKSETIIIEYLKERFGANFNTL
ncbi:MAG TPA: cytidylate kinase-like family protein [Clostridium sp.]